MGSLARLNVHLLCSQLNVANLFDKQISFVQFILIDITKLKLCLVYFLAREITIFKDSWFLCVNFLLLKRFCQK